MASAVRSEAAAAFFKANFQQPEPSAVQWEGACRASRRCRIQPGLNWAMQAVEQAQVPRQAEGCCSPRVQGRDQPLLSLTAPRGQAAGNVLILVY